MREFHEQLKKGEDEFDISPTPEDIAAAPENKEFNITPDGVQENNSDEQVLETAEENAAESKEEIDWNAELPQPVWYDSVHEGLKTQKDVDVSGAPEKPEAVEAKEEKNLQEEINWDAPLPQPVWYDSVREGLPSAQTLEAEKAHENLIHEDVEKVIAEMPQEERRSFANTLLRGANGVNIWKSGVLGGAFKGAAELISDRKKNDSLEEKPFVKRLFEAYGVLYSDLAEKARRDGEKFNTEGGTKTAVTSVMSATGTVLTWGRAVVGYGTPLGTVTAAAMAVGRGGEAVKEAYLESKDVIQEGRVHDIDAAEAEAWKLYEDAKEKSDNGTVAKDQLIQAYAEHLPQDIIDRLAKDAGDRGFIAQCAQRIAQRNIERSAKEIQEKLSEIENNNAFSKEQKAKNVERLLGKYESFLKNTDRMVGNNGEINARALVAQKLGKAGRVAAGVMALETLGEIAVQGAEALSEFVNFQETETDISGENISGNEGVDSRYSQGENVSPNDENALIQASTERLTDFALKEKLGGVGLTMEDLGQSKLTSVELESVATGVALGGFGENAGDIVKTIAENPDSEKNLDNTVVHSLLSNTTLSEGRVQEIVSMDTAGVVGRGESISEVLGVAVPLDMKITVVNPDGTTLENFDANLVHYGDTVIRGNDGSVTVFKTSDIAVSHENSLQGVYDSIKKGLDEKGIPSEIQNALNQGEGHWDGQISRAEATDIEKTWNTLRDDFNALHEDEKKSFLSKLSQGMTGERVSELLHEQRVGMSELVTEEVSPDMSERFGTVAEERNEAVKETMEKVYTPEEIKEAEIPDETPVPPLDGRVPGERIAPDAWDKNIGEKKFVIHDDVLDDIDPQEQEKPPARVVASSEDLPEAKPMRGEYAAPVIAEKMADHVYSYKGPEGVFTGKFLYNEHNEVIGVQPRATLGMNGVTMVEKSILNDNWMEQPLEVKNQHLARQEIKIAAYDLGVKKRILGVMEKAGEKDTKEYHYLKNAIDRRIGKLEEKFGDIFK